MFTNIQLNRVTKPIGLVRCDKAAWLIVHMWVFKLLNEAAWPSHYTDLAERLAMWTRHKKIKTVKIKILSQNEVNLRWFCSGPELFLFKIHILEHNIHEF